MELHGMDMILVAGRKMVTAAVMVAVMVMVVDAEIHVLVDADMRVPAERVEKNAPAVRQIAIPLVVDQAIVVEDVMPIVLINVLTVAPVVTLVALADA